MNLQELCRQITRRELFGRIGVGAGSVALAWMLEQEARTAPVDPRNPLAPRAGHLAPCAKNMIHLHMVGAPSQLELFDHKPELQKHDGKPCPQEFLDGKRFAFLRGHPKLMGTRFKFRRHGEIGRAHV